MPTRHLMMLLIAPLYLGCPDQKEEDSVQQEDDSAADSWRQEDVEEPAEEPDDGTDDDDKPDEGDDKPDDEGDEYKECDEGFDPEESCEGDHTMTLCVYDGMFWWCDDGVWLNEDDKP